MSTIILYNSKDTIKIDKSKVIIKYPLVEDILLLRHFYGLYFSEFKCFLNFNSIVPGHVNVAFLASFMDHFKSIFHK